MPYKGRPPKDEADRINQNPKRYEKTILETDEEEVVRGFVLPAIPGVIWCKQTIEWWETWRRSPQAKLMGDTDWQFMLECAIAHNEIFRPRTPGKPIAGTTLIGLLAELRQRVGKFGATWEDRQKLQLQIQTPQTQEEVERKIRREATSAVDYATMLNKAAADVKGADGGFNSDRDGS